MGLLLVPALVTAAVATFSQPTPAQQYDIRLARYYDRPITAGRPDWYRQEAV